MRTQYLLDDVRRRAGGALRRLLAHQEHAKRERYRRAAFAIGVLALLAGTTWAVWRVAFAPPEVQAPAAQASVPEHQLSGPLANPWGPGTPVMAERGAEAPAAAASSAPAATDPAMARGEPKLDSPAARDAMRAALAQFRTSPRAAEFVNKAMQGGDPAQLAVAWMAERQCRQVAQWRQMFEWRTRAMQPGARNDPLASLPATGVSPQLRTLVTRCVDMPNANLLEAALASAGFATSPELTEPTRRPLDLARAVALGDATMLATVLDTSTAEETSAWVAARTAQRGAGPPETDIEVLRAALWLASCRAGSGGGGAGNKRADCADHPAVWQGCTQQGLCDARDLHDLLLRTMSTQEWHASERLAQMLAPLMGR